MISSSIRHRNRRCKRADENIRLYSDLAETSDIAPTIDQGVSCMSKGKVRGERPNVRRKYLSPDEARRVIDAAGKVGRQRLRDQTLLTLIYRHGLRVSEAVNVRWTDFDLNAPRDRTFFVRRLKGGNDGTHTLEPDTVRLLKRLKAESDSPYVFVSERGGPMSVDAVQLIVKRAGELAGLEFQAHPHQLRHAAGFALANQDGIANDTRLIQDFLGHKDIKSTVIYTTLSQKRLSAVRVR
jgi:integrase